MDMLFELSTSKDSSLKNKISIEKWYIHYNDAIIYSCSSDQNTVAILGEFIHINHPYASGNKIVKEIANLNDFNEVLTYSKQLLGRFVIFWFDNESAKIIPDPTASIPINYMENIDNTVVSSDSYHLKNKFDLEYSQTSLRIKDSTENQQPLPYNLTMFDEMKTLIPNHYFDSSKNSMVRFYPLSKIEKTSLKDAVDETITIIDRIIPYVMEANKVSLPLTAGIDSRLVLAFLKDYMEEIPAYTFYNKGDEVDLKVAKLLADRFGFKHHSMKREKLTNEQILYYEERLTGNHNTNILSNGQTLKNSPLHDYSFLAGDIIPLAKSNFGKNLPDSFATLNYLVTKTHNHSKENKESIGQWLEEVKGFNYISVFDLFFWEYRFGRWLPNNANNYDVFTEPLYLFNCRYLIELWLSVTREERSNISFHEEIIKKKWPELLEVPLNPKNKIFEKLISNQYIFYAGSFVKFYLSKLQ